MRIRKKLSKFHERNASCLQRSLDLNLNMGFRSSEAAGLGCRLSLPRPSELLKGILRRRGAFLRGLQGLQAQDSSFQENKYKIQGILSNHLKRSATSRSSWLSSSCTRTSRECCNSFLRLQPSFRMASTSNASPKTSLENVVQAMNKIAPLSLADTSWDNVGVLLEAANPRRTKNVFLAIDLTTSVAEECLSDPSISVAVVYHPIIFRGLKSITMKDPQQQSLLKFASAGISIYCPHTSLDACFEGINHWMKDSVKLNEKDKIQARPIIPTKVEGQEESVGMGHFVERDPIALEELIPNIKKHFGVSHRELCLCNIPIASGFHLRF